MTRTTQSDPAPEETRQERGRRTRRRGGLYFWMFVLVALVVMLVALAVDNTDPVQLSWIFGSSEPPLVWIILSSAILGWLVGIITGIVIRHSTRRRS
jgi:uncharacterized integral membrane protein